MLKRKCTACSGTRTRMRIHCLIPMLLLQVPIHCTVLLQVPILYMNVYRASFGRHFCEDRAVGRGVDRGGFPFPGNPPGRIIFF